MALIDKASLLMVPSTYEAGTLYNVLPSGNRAPDETGSNSGYDQTRADFTFDRGTNAAATRVNADGLIEKYRENLYTQSNNFGHSDWTPKAGTFTQGVEDPDGGNNAWSWTATNTDPYLYQNKNLSGVHCLSIWVKGIGNTIGHNLEIRVGASINYVELTSEWQRVEAFAVLSGSVNIGFEYGNPAATSGDVIHIYQAQLETGLVATDYLDSGATTAKAGVLVDLPRINYDANGENGALLLEPQRTNLLPYSEHLTGYTIQNLSIDYNNAISPEGLKNAIKLTDNSTSGFHRLINSVTTTAQDYTFSVYIKSGTMQDAYMQILGGGTVARATFDLDNVSTNAINGSSKIEDVGNDWYRCSITGTANAGTTYCYLHLNGTSTYVGTNEDLFIYGLQLEAGSYVSSYIPNHGTSGGVTRAADSCSVTGVSDVIGQTEGTLFVECEYERTSTAVGARKLISVNSGNSTNLVDIFCPSSANNLTARVRANGGQFGAISISNAPTGMIKIAYAYKANDYALYINGTQYGTDTTGGAFTFSSSVNIHQIGDGEANGDELGGSIKKSILFKERLSNAELAALTA